MEESRYLQLVDVAWKKIQDAFEDVDPDLAEAYSAGDVLTISFADRSRCVVNTQRPTRQVWLAARSRAWHFSYDDATHTWLDDKGRGDELYATLARTVRESSGVELVFK